MLHLAAVAAGLLLVIYGAALMLMSSRLAYRGDDPVAASRARWRHRRGIAVLIAGILVLIFGGIVLPLSTRLVLSGPGGVLFLVFLNIVGLVLDAIGIVFIFLSGVTMVEHHELDAHWLGRARHRTYLGIAVLFGALLAQLLGVLLIIW